MAGENKLPPLPIREPFLVGSRALVTQPWLKFFQQLFVRAGGFTALNNVELEEAIESSTNPLPQTSHDLTGGAGPVNLTGEVYDNTIYSSVFVFMEILRGATVISGVIWHFQCVSGTWSVVHLLTGERSSQSNSHGVVLTFNGDQLRAQETTGDDTTIRMKKILMEKNVA